MSISKFNLYSTLGCHLCEQAEDLLNAAGLSYSVVDIADSDELMDIYGIRIPVLKNTETGAELGWPFDGPALSIWLKQ